MLQYKCLAESNCNENLLESEEMCTQDIFSDLNEKFDLEITQEIEWFLYNLISMASRCYDLVIICKYFLVIYFNTLNILCFVSERI